MRILIIGVNYLPEKTGIGPYTAGLANYLVRRGHAVDVVTGLPSYPEWRVHDQFRHVLWRTDLEEGVRVHRRWHYVPKTQSAIRRLAYEATFLLTGFSALWRKRPNLVIGIVPSLSGGVLARVVSKRFGVPYALILQDLMGPAASQTGVSGARHVASLVTAAERWICSHAAVIGIIAESFRPHLERLGIEPDKIHRVRNWTRTKDCTEDRSLTRGQIGWDTGQVICLHAGNMGHKQGLENILMCAQLAQQHGYQNLHFVLLGEGNQRFHLQQVSSNLGLRNVTFLPLQSEEALTNILAAADILILNQRAGVSDMALPSKLTSYMASGRPVIAAVEGCSETAKEIFTAGAGAVVEPENPEALLAAICELWANPEQQERFGSRAKRHASIVLSPDSVLPQLAAMFAQLER